MGRGRTPTPGELTTERAEELGRCYKSYIYFISNYCTIYDSVTLDWIPFTLWKCQKDVLNVINSDQQIVILKARQLGISWLTLGYALWHIIFRPIAAVSIFSRRDTESMYLMGSDRLRGMYNNLPLWLKTGNEAVINSGHEWILKNGSAVRAFPTSAGDGYVSSLAIVDEADLTPDLNQMMRSVKPTIQAGGKLILLSRVNKEVPESDFKKIYRAAKAGENGWTPVFLPWTAHPDRDVKWYDAQRRDVLSRTGALDELYEQYPETDTQALSPKVLDKRIPPMWIEVCYSEVRPLRVRGSPSLSGFDIYFAPIPGVRYVLGADPAEGNPNSDDSSLTVVRVDTGEEVASLAGKYEPAIFASHIAAVSSFYNFAPAMVERNNHGHSVIQWLEEHARRVRLLLGHDAEVHKTDKKTRRKQKRLKAGWLSSKLGNAILYTLVTEFFRASARFDEEDGQSIKVLHSLPTFNQLCSVEAATLSAPEGMHDDRADSFSLAQAGRVQLEKKGAGASLEMVSTGGWGW